MASASSLRAAAVCCSFSLILGAPIRTQALPRPSAETMQRDKREEPTILGGFMIELGPVIEYIFIFIFIYIYIYIYIYVFIVCLSLSHWQNVKCIPSLPQLPTNQHMEPDVPGICPASFKGTPGSMLTCGLV